MCHFTSTIANRMPFFVSPIFDSLLYIKLHLIVIYANKNNQQKLIIVFNFSQ